MKIPENQIIRAVKDRPKEYVKCCYDMQPPPRFGVAEAVGYKKKFWQVGQKISYSFFHEVEEEIKEMVRASFARWMQYANLQFVEVADQGMLRLSFYKNRGSWSYIGTDNLTIPFEQPTMNFGWLEDSTFDHEIGHAIGLGHEHQNPNGGIEWDVEAVVDDLSGPPNNWSYEQVKWNVLERYDKNITLGTEVDKDSIMMYPIPAHWTKDGFSAQGGDVISATDKAFVAYVYPYPKEESDMVKFWQKIFRSKRELNENYKRVVVRVAETLDLEIGRKWKSTLVREISEILKIQ